MPLLISLIRHEEEIIVRVHNIYAGFLHGKRIHIFLRRGISATRLCFRLYKTVIYAVFVYKINHKKWKIKNVVKIQIIMKKSERGYILPAYVLP